MGLPINIFYFLIIIAVALFVFGLTRHSVGAGFSFTSLSGIFFILTGLLIWTSGLQTSVVESIDTSNDIITNNYQTLTFQNDLAIQMLSYFLVFGGFFPIILAIKNVFDFRNQQKIEQLTDY
jgi:hypothetical protein